MQFALPPPSGDYIAEVLRIRSDYAETCLPAIVSTFFSKRFILIHKGLFGCVKEADTRDG